MMFVRAQLGPLAWALYRQTGFVNHQGAAKAQHGAEAATAGTAVSSNKSF
jgi:hypothetical protein